MTPNRVRGLARDASDDLAGRGEPTKGEVAERRPDPVRTDDLFAMLRIRHFELALLHLFAQSLVHGTTHTCIGQEYVPVAVDALLDREDYVLSNHRGHGHYLARFGDLSGLLAEIMGREGAVCGGVGGSQHIKRDRYVSTGVLGESMTVAAGLALHLRDAEPGRLACVYLGDGSWGEGAVYEALNIAALWRLPLLVVVENNGIAQSTRTERQMAGTIAARAAAFNIPHRRIDDDDPASIRAALAGPVEEVRHEPYPLVVEFRTRRLGPHSKGDDTRTEDELMHLRAHDWATRRAEQDPDGFRATDERARAEVDLVVRQVSARPLCDGRAAR